MTETTRPGRGLGRYVPRVAAEWDLDSPGRRWQSLDASLCFVDISGFTNLAERLARRGRIGAEELTEVLNRVFGTMLALAYERTGSLLKFGGDALLLLFRGDDHAAQAASAAVEMRGALREAAAIPTSVGTVPLRMSVGIHSGRVELFHVGRSHRELVIAGPAATTTTRMEHAAGPGEIVVSAATRELLAPGAADRQAGPGWRLGWRQPRTSAPGPVPARPVSTEAVAECIPVGLRSYLIDGAVEPEHRAATVGFVRFSGIDRIVEEDGPEIAADALDRFVTVVQSAADEQLVTFLATDIDENGGKVILAAGVPATREDDDGRMLRTVRRIADTSGSLPVRIGVNRGHVFSGAVGMRFRATFTVMGDTVNLAARLMAAAPEGAIYVTPAVVERSRTTFATTALPPFQVKGKAAPVAALALGAETGTRAAAGGDLLPFVGRDEDHAALVERLEALTRGDGGSLLIEGAAGLGKTRLVDEGFSSAPPMTTTVVRGEPYGTAFPYRALRDAVRDLLGVQRADPALMARSLLRRLRLIDPDLLPLAPLVGEVAHIHVPSTVEVDEVEPRFRRDRTADAIITLLASRTDGPVVIVVDDAHWVDEASAHLLGRLAAAASDPVEPRPWLVMAVRRPGPGGFRPDGPELPVRPLSYVRTEHLVWSATEASPLRHHDARAVVNRANGNPLFVHEILRLVAQTGSTAALPDSLDSVVGAEIDALAPKPRRILRCASVLGQSFRDETLQLLLEGDGIDPGDTLTEDLAPFLEPDGEGRWRFRQALTRDVAYEGLAFRRRRQLHQTAGVVTEKLAEGRVDQVADLLARHYAAAQDHEQAWHWAGLAAQRARGSYANVEAATHYETALDAARRLPDVPEVEKAAMWTGLGDVREQLGMFNAALEAYGRAAQLVRDDPLALARLALRRGRAQEQTGLYTAALRGVRSAARRLRPLESDLAYRWRARLTAFEAIVRQGQELPEEAMAVAWRGVEQAEDAGERFALAQAYAVIDWALIVLGRADEAVFMAKALAIYEELEDLPRQAAMLNNLGAAAYFEGRWDVASDYYERAREASRRSGNEALAALAGANHGEILVNQGRLDEAESLLLEAQRVLRATGSESVQFADLQLGRLAMERGDLERAERLLTCSHQDATAVGMHGSALEVAIQLSRCHLLRDDPSTALDILRRAQRAAKAEAALYDVQVAEVETRILARLELYEQARAANEAGVAEARRQNLVYELALLLLAAADVAEREGDGSGSGPLAEATALLERLGCRVPSLPVDQRAQRGSPAPK